MSSTASEKKDSASAPPKPIVKKMRWPFPFIWLVPILAAAVAGYLFYDKLADRGLEITLRFNDASGLKAGDSHIEHLGVQIGQVSAVDLSPDKKQVLVKVRLYRAQSDFARKGAQFWIVRPEVSTQEITGLGTILSGPVVDSMPGTGDAQADFTGLDRPPSPVVDGLSIILKTAQSDHLQADSPVYFRGIQVGQIEEINLASDATSADVRALIQRRFIPLVKTNSQFWVLNAVDLKGGLFTGVQMKVESIRSLLAGGVAFATPEKDMGDQAQNGSTFVLHDDVKKDWLAWEPRIAIAPEEPGNGNQNLALPQAPQAIRSAVGSN